MKKICLSLPTNRECGATIALLAEEAAYAAQYFDVEVDLLILDTSAKSVFRQNAAAVNNIPHHRHVIPLHLDSDDQRQFLAEAIDRAGLAEPDKILRFMLPNGVSYGACTNRAFLIGSALGCETLHRRDSDSRYQMLDSKKIFPIHHELMSLGKTAAAAKIGVTEVKLDAAHERKPVCLVGASFIGEMSVDIADIRERDKNIYFDLVSLWAADNCTQQEKQALVDESFTGAGTDAFIRDQATLAIVDPMSIDMCNISFYRVHEQIPLLPAMDTIGSDYFLMHVVRNAQLPGVHHNRHIENFYTRERKTGRGFIDYQFRLIKFFLSMLYLHFIYAKLAAAGPSLLNGDGSIRVPMIIDMVKDSTRLDKAQNERKLDVIQTCYRKLGGKHAEFAEILDGNRARLLAEAENDIHEFAELLEVWEPLMRAAKALGLQQPLRRAS
jgi:hypothetical protein